MDIFIYVIFLGQIFIKPLDVPTNPTSLLWALPVCLCIAMVHKAVKLESFEPGLVVREVLYLFLTIVGFLILSAVVLVGILHFAT